MANAVAEGVGELGRVARAVAEAEPETVAVLGCKTEWVPVGESVVVFETLRLRVSVGEPVEVRESARLIVEFPERVDVFVPSADRVFVFEVTGDALIVGVEVSVRELFAVIVIDEEPVDVLDELIVLVWVRVTPILRDKGGEEDCEGQAEVVLEARIVAVPVGHPVELLEGAPDAVGVALPVDVFVKAGDEVVVLETVTLRVVLGLPVVVDVPLAELEGTGLDVVVLEAPTERVAVFVEVAVFVGAAVTVPGTDGQVLTLGADVCVEVRVDAAEKVTTTSPATRFRPLRTAVRRFRASAPNSVVLIQGEVVRVPSDDSKSIHRILY